MSRLVCLVVMGCAACGSDDTQTAYIEWPAFEGSIDDAHQECVDRINAYRATEGKAPYERWLDAEACADEQAELDAGANRGHANFGMCDEGAQNSCLRRRSLDSILSDCLQSMWSEGPGSFEESGHYLNMASTSHTRVACGFYRMTDGSIWANQNFR